MMQSAYRSRKKPFQRVLLCAVTLNFLLSAVVAPQTGFAQVSATSSLPHLPAVGTMLNTSAPFAPALMKGVQVNAQNPLELNFIINTGEAALESEALRNEANKLIKYFMASLTVPEDELWVNLSPYEKDRIIPDAFGLTDMGRDLLSQDYLLKQLTASLVYPEKQLGQEFWNRVYKLASEKYGTSDVSIGTFNKIWIVPDKAVVYENNGTAYIVESHLKVMHEEDYLALQEDLGSAQFGTDVTQRQEYQDMSEISTKIIKEVLVPEIEKEVNEGKQFAQLRQIYHSMILAAWYKNALSESLLAKVYVDQNKVVGIDLEDKQAKEKIFKQYLEAFKVGVYDFIKEDYDPVSQEIVPRKYFSGGFKANQLSGQVRSSLIRHNSASGADMAVVSGVVENDAPNNISVRAGLVEASNPQIAELLNRMRPESNDGDQGMLSAYNGPVDFRNLFQTFDRESVQLTRQFDQEVQTALSFLRARGVEIATDNVSAVIAETGDQRLFGAYYDQQAQRVIIERSLVNLVEARNNPFDMLQRIFVYALTPGTHEQKRVAEFDFARQRFPDLSSRLAVNVEGVLSSVLSDVDRSDADMSLEIEQKIQQSLWEIGVHMMNGDIHPERKVLLTEEDRARGYQAEDDQGDISMVWLATSSNPIHWGHIEFVLRLMAQQKHSMIAFRTHGDDFRKPALRFSISERHAMAREFLAQFGGLIRYTDMGRNNDLDGESEMVNLLKANEGRAGKLHLVYPVGTDHMHWYAPDKWVQAPSAEIPQGIRHPKKMNDGSFQPDTIQKLWRFSQDNAESLSRHGQSISLAFNERDPQDGIPMEEEKDILADLKSRGFYNLMRGANLEGASSTAIRNLFSGIEKDAQKRAVTLSLLPTSIKKFIEEEDSYRAIITELSKRIDVLFKASEGQSLTEAEIEESFAAFKQWLDQYRKNQGDQVSDEILSRVLRMPENLIREARLYVENYRPGPIDQAMAAQSVRVELERIRDSKILSGDILRAQDLGGVIQASRNTMELVEVERFINSNLSTSTITAEEAFVANAWIYERKAILQMRDSAMMAEVDFTNIERILNEGDAQAVRDMRDGMVQTLQALRNDRAGRVLLLSRAELSDADRTATREMAERISGQIDRIEGYLRSSNNQAATDDAMAASTDPVQFSESIFQLPQIDSRTAQVLRLREVLQNLRRFETLDAYDNGFQALIQGVEHEEGLDLIEQLLDAKYVANSSLVRGWINARRASLAGRDMASAAPVGGIDLNPALLDLQIRRDGGGIPLPLDAQPLQHMHIEGFVPVIINISPVTNLPLLMGMDQQPQGDANYSYQSTVGEKSDKLSLLTK